MRAEYSRVGTAKASGRCDRGAHDPTDLPAGTQFHARVRAREGVRAWGGRRAGARHGSGTCFSRRAPRDARRPPDSNPRSELDGRPDRRLRTSCEPSSEPATLAPMPVSSSRIKAAVATALVLLAGLGDARGARRSVGLATQRRPQAPRRGSAGARRVPRRFAPRPHRRDRSRALSQLRLAGRRRHLVQERLLRVRLDHQGSAADPGRQEAGGGLRGRSALPPELDLHRARQARLPHRERGGSHRDLPAAAVPGRPHAATGDPSAAEQRTRGALRPLRARPAAGAAADAVGEARAAAARARTCTCRPGRARAPGRATSCPA